MKKSFILILIFLGSIFCFSVVKAEELRVHLYYQAENKELRFDKLKDQAVTQEKQMNRWPSEFLLDNAEVKGKYLVKIFDLQGVELFKLEFNPKPRAFDLELPYYSIASQLKIYDKTSNEEILTADLSEFITCNLNGVCEFELGETEKQCLGDCGASPHSYSEETLKKLQKEGGVLKDPQTGEVLLDDPKVLEKDSNSSSKGNFSILNPQQTKEEVSSSSNKLITIFLVIVLFIIMTGMVFFIRKFILKK